MTNKKFKKIWKYLLGAGAGVILAGAVVGGVVSCSNGNNNNTNTNRINSNNTRQTPNTTSDYQLTPQAQQGITYNESLQPKTSSMIATDISYASTQTLQQQQGLDVYVGGILASVITPKTPSVNLTLSLTDLGQLIDGAQFKTMGSLIAFEPSNSQNVVNLTPDGYGLLQKGTTSPWAVQFNLTGDSKPIDVDFPMVNNQINFQNVTGKFPVDGVNINLNIDLKPFNGGITKTQTWSTLYNVKTVDGEVYGAIHNNQTAMDKYLTAGDFKKPFDFSLLIPQPNNTISQYSLNGVWYNEGLNGMPSMTVPLTPIITDGKVTAWKTPTDTYYVTYQNGEKFVLEQYQYSFPSTVNWGLDSYYAQKEVKTLTAEIQQLNQYEQTIQTLEQTNKNDQSTIQQLGTYLNQASQQLQADEQAQQEANKTLTQANNQINSDEQTIQYLQNELSEDSGLIQQLKNLATGETPTGVTYSEGNNGVPYSLDNASLYSGLEYTITVPDSNYYPAVGTLYYGSVNSSTVNPKPVSNWGNKENTCTWYTYDLKVGTYTLAYQISTNNFTSKITYVPFSVQQYTTNE